MRFKVKGIGIAVLALLPLADVSSSAQVRGWLSWRGPEQTGVSRETGLPSTVVVGGAGNLWSVKFSGGGTPVIANGKIYAFGYAGTGPDLQEVLYCADAESGKKLWEKRFSDYLSDIVYDRYAIGSPAIDPETGNVYVLTSAGEFACFTSTGSLVFQNPTMQTLGRLTFTNGRTGAPTIEGDMVIMRGITSNWGGEGAAMDRLYAFDKKTGKLIWSLGSGAPPKDNSFARPFFLTLGGKRLLVTGCGDGSVICANARTGQVVWRYPISAGGLNASVVVYKNLAIAIHADENLDSSEIGRMTAIKIDAVGKPTEGLPPQLEKTDEAWRNELASISSSPVLVGNRIYQVNRTGNLCSVNADTGKVLWKFKLGPDQLHASPLYADGKLYIPMQNGLFYIIQPSDTGAKVLSKVQLAGRCIGAPSVWNGKVYVHSTERLYCFGKPGSNPGLPAAVAAAATPKPGVTAALQVLPSEVLLRPGEKATFTIRGIDANGFVTQSFKASDAKWEKYIPPTARVKSTMNGEFNSSGELIADSAQSPSAGAFMATIGAYKGVIRGRVLPSLPFSENFEEFKPSEPDPTETGLLFAYPPLPWIGARFKFDVRDVDGNKVFAKTLDNVFFQRATVFFGHPDDSNYTLEADVQTEGNRRTKSTVGLINQRYYIILNGNADEIEINSNQERIKVTRPFKIKPRVWYHMTTRVDVAADGSGVVRAKAWPRDEAEPAAWSIEVPHKSAHKKGAPGLFGFAPQSLFKVYIDNIKVTPNR